MLPVSLPARFSFGAKRSKRWAIPSGEMPSPVSVTVTRTQPSPASSATVISPPRVCRLALERRLSTTWRIRPSSAITSGRS